MKRLVSFSPVLLFAVACQDVGHPTGPAVPGPNFSTQSTSFSLDGMVETQITTDAELQGEPAISGDRIVWQDFRNGNLDIYLFDLSNGIETPITTDASSQMFPAISGDRVVWVDGRNPSGDLFALDLISGVETQLTMDPAVPLRPAISGDRVVWMDVRNGNWDIYLLDLSTGTERQITDEPQEQINPAISGDRIVWRDERNGNWDIYLFDLSTDTETQITALSSAQVEPAISGDLIVWRDQRNDVGDIYLFDLNTETETRITTLPSAQFDPAISGDRITYADFRNGNTDIYLFDLSTGVETQITTDLAHQFGPAISGDRIVWEDSLNGNRDIYALLPSATSDPGITETGTSVAVTPTDEATGEAAPTTITFDEVTGSGETTVTSGTVGGSGSPPSPGTADFKLGQPPTYYDIETTATFTGSVEICIDYSGSSYGNESQLKLLHFNEATGAWEDVTTSLDTQTTTICGVTDSLSPFLVAEKNAVPVVTGISLPSDPVPVGTEVSASATFTDANPTDVHTAQIDWEAGTTAGTVTESSGSGSVAGSFTFAEAGVYTIGVTVSDDGGLAGTRSSSLDDPSYIVVYDPEGGFVTGGGWIHSPEGAYAADPSLTGKASFGFVSKYRKGAMTPSGNTEFKFKAGNLEFRSASYEWLVVAGARGQFKGEGTINGTGAYGFMLTAIDGEVNGGGGVDRFRIKIWDKATDQVVYDNQMGETDDSDATTELGRGSIVIHSK